MKKLNILFNTSPGSFKNAGGGEMQLLETKKELEKLGHSVKILEQENYQVNWESFDIFHNFNIHRDNLEFIEKAKKADLPVAISTIYWHAPLQKIGSGTGLKGLAVETINMLAPGQSKVGKIVKQADVLLPNSLAEAMQLEKVFGVAEEKIAVVHNGVQERFAKASPNDFEKEFGLKDFVLYVGRIEERKNVLGMIEAFNSIGNSEKLVVIGSAAEKDAAYLETCKRTANESVLFLPPMEHEGEMLASAYAACKVFCLPSFYETPGLAALEAGLAGANLVVTQEGCTKEYFGEHALYVNPNSVADILEKIVKGIKMPKSKDLSRHILENFLWEKAAKQTLEAYKKIT